MNQTLPSFGPGFTPKTITWLILVTVIVSLLSAVTQTLMNQFGYYPGPQDIFSLSWWGFFTKGYIWQPITYLFVQGPIQNGITFSYLITLFFNMYLVWILGTHLVEIRGRGPFLRLYFISGILAGALSLLFIHLTGKYAVLAGAGPSVLALLTVWSMAFPETEIMLFFLIPMKAKWIIAGLFGAILLVTLTQGDFPDLVLYISAILFGYTYAAMAWGWPSPFEFTQPLDSRLAALGLRLRPYLPHWAMPKHKVEGKPNVIDMNTGKPLDDDDAFVDAMLAKISKQGENSLSWSERRRLNLISERKMQNRR